MFRKDGTYPYQRDANHTANAGLTLEKITLQSLADYLGEENALRSCTPVSFYMLLKNAGYISHDLSLEDYMERITADRSETVTADWSRPSLSKELRKRYGAPIVSWVVNGEQLYGGVNLEEMKSAGYVSTPEEIDFFNTSVAGKDFETIARSNVPIMVTVKPNFGNSGTNNIHSVIITSWGDEAVHVVDADSRNIYETYTPEAMRESIDLRAAGTIVLPSITD